MNSCMDQQAGGAKSQYHLLRILFIVGMVILVASVGTAWLYYTECANPMMYPSMIAGSLLFIGISINMYYGLGSRLFNMSVLVIIIVMVALSSINVYSFSGFSIDCDGNITIPAGENGVSYIGSETELAADVTKLEALKTAEGNIAGAFQDYTNTIAGINTPEAPDIENTITQLNAMLESIFDVPAEGEPVTTLSQEAFDDKIAEFDFAVVLEQHREYANDLADNETAKQTAKDVLNETVNETITELRAMPVPENDAVDAVATDEETALFTSDDLSWLNNFTSNTTENGTVTHTVNDTYLNGTDYPNHGYEDEYEKLKGVQGRLTKIKRNDSNPTMNH